jgi:hypothetical protein
VLLLYFFFEDLYKPEAFGFAIRPAFGDLDAVTEAGLIVLIVDAQFRSALQVFSVHRMPDPEVNGNFNAFATAVTYHHADYSF